MLQCKAYRKLGLKLKSFLLLLSFVNVVKSAEPVFAAALSAVILGATLPLPVWMSLLPICGGVALAGAGELRYFDGPFLKSLVPASHSYEDPLTSFLASASRGLVLLQP